MAFNGNFSLFTLCLLLSSSSLFSGVDGQSFFFKNHDITRYEIRNGQYKIITTTTTTTTTPPPSIMETLFPWTGTAYNSVRTPEEDEALINSLSDPPPPDTGIMSWLPSMPSMPSMPSLSMPSMPSIPGFRGSSSSSPPPSPPRSPPYPYPPPPPPYQQGPPTSYNGYPPPGPPPMMMGAASNIQPIVVPPPGQENQLGMQGISPFPPSQFPDQYSMPYPSSPMGYPAPPPPSQELPSTQDPTFQFHTAMKDSINIPTPSLPNFGQPSSFAFPGSKQSSSIVDMISSYFSFGKRSDDLSDEGQARNMHGGGLNRFMMQPRSNDDDTVEIAVDEGEDDYGDHGDNGKDGMDDDGETKDGEDGEAAEETKASNPAEDKPYACPKGGIWRWDGEVCIAVGPVPIWACKPNDLVVSGKIAICRNKIFFSPKVINNIQATKLSGRF